MVNSTIRPCPVSSSFPIWLLFFLIALTANQTGVHLYLAGDKKSPDFYRTKQLSIDSEPIYIGQGRQTGGDIKQ